MRPACCYCRFNMLFFLLSRTRPDPGWFWRILERLWRLAARIFQILVTFSARLALPWREEGGTEPATGDQNKPPVRRYSEDDVEGFPGEEPGERSSTDPETPRERTSVDAEEPRVEPTDEFYCNYDSTWETEPKQDGIKVFRKSRNEKFRSFERAARDMQNYRHNYPMLNGAQFQRHPVSDKPNLSFYLGQTPSLPDGVFIHNFHSQWHGDYIRLEHVHTFIQWLFPLREPGVNDEARTLSEEEIQEFRENGVAKSNLLKSYKLMLDFYGMELVDEATGEVMRAANWRERFDNLNRNTHNNLRITRILKCLGTLGFAHFQAPLVRFFLRETLEFHQLPRVRDSVLNYFVFSVLDKSQRRSLLRFAYRHYRPTEEFVWCPKKIQMFWSRRSVPT